MHSSIWSQSVFVLVDSHSCILLKSGIFFFQDRLEDSKLFLCLTYFHHLYPFLIFQGTKTIAGYDHYCHYVAGLVGEGLSRIFSVEIEGEKVTEASTTLANSMGLVLQKTNITRDFLEDYVDGRTFWPKEVKCFCFGG